MGLLICLGMNFRLILARLLTIFVSPPPLLCVIGPSFDIFPQSVVKIDYRWRENDVTLYQALELAQ